MTAYYWNARGFPGVYTICEYYHRTVLERFLS
jgi:hypothetical protein